MFCANVLSVLFQTIIFSSSYIHIGILRPPTMRMRTLATIIITRLKVHVTWSWVLAMGVQCGIELLLILFAALEILGVITTYVHADLVLRCI